MPEEILHHDAITDDDITRAMVNYGGSFVAALGRLWQIADDDNRARLRDAFPVYFEQYAELVAMKRRNAAAVSGHDQRRV